MKPALYNLKIHAGEDFEEKFSFKSGGQPLNLTGYNVKAQIALEADPPQSVVDLTAAVTNAAAGEITISLTRAQTRNITVKGGRWDLFLIDGSGKARPYLVGQVTFAATVTVVP